MDNIIPLRINHHEVSRLDLLIDQGRFRNRNEGIRSALRDLLDKVGNPWLIQAQFAARIAARLISQKWPKRVITVLLYGSIAKAQMTEESDIDLAVIIDNIPHYPERVEMVERIDQIIPEWSSAVSIVYFSAQKFSEQAFVQGTVEAEIKRDGIDLLRD